MGSDDGENVRRVQLDQRAAFLTFDALEREIVSAAYEEEMEVAAETAAALFVVQAQLPEWTDEYHGISAEFEVPRNTIAYAMEEVREWAVENDHRVREWFEEAE